jgi:hypothetical protein
MLSNLDSKLMSNFDSKLDLEKSLNRVLLLLKIILGFWYISDIKMEISKQTL